ncbi:hypothetical protein SAMN04488527_10190 [Aliiroseovarius crassostreae]|nr:hypothetical protein [Aliiroseovarius crassostreae]SFU28473.1 hypothetical protein SAMN04488527_10190 [Aliiroseovarius crassostreae]
MKFKWAVFATISASVSACIPTTEGYQQLVNDWKGSSEQELIAQWGVPDKSYRSGGNQYISYVRRGSVYIPGTQPTYTTTVYGNVAYTNSYGGTPGQNISTYCETTFVLASGRIKDATFKGNDCTAVPKSDK